MFPILFGTKGKTTDVARGQFFCPRCRGVRPYVRKKVTNYFTLYFIKHPPRPNDAIPLGPVKLVAHTVTNDRVVMVGLQLADPEPVPRTLLDKVRVRGRRVLRRTWAWLKSRVRRS